MRSRVSLGREGESFLSPASWGTGETFTRGSGGSLGSSRASFIVGFLVGLQSFWVNVR